MFDTTTRRAHRDHQARSRLDRLIHAARADQAEQADDLPADQEWIEEPAATPGPVSTQDDPPSPRGEPWWRRGRAGRLVERWAPGGPDGVSHRRVPIAVLAALVLGGAVAIGVAVSSGGNQETPPGLPAVSAVADSEPSPPPAGATTIVVSVVGRVVQPGLVTLSDGARVADALRAAGGPSADVDISALNIARRVADGEQIYVGIPPPPDVQPGAEASGVPAKVDLNAASLAQLDTLPGVGAVTAQRILDWRTKHGRFTRVEQLREVDGIGPARFGQLKDLVVVR